MYRALFYLSSLRLHLILWNFQVRAARAYLFSDAHEIARSDLFSDREASREAVPVHWRCALRESRAKSFLLMLLLMDRTAE
jgi:hypothetical protein